MNPSQIVRACIERRKAKAPKAIMPRGPTGGSGELRKQAAAS